MKMKNQLQFEIPIVLFVFKRFDKIIPIVERLAEVKPKKVYIIADGPRDDSDIEAVRKCREQIEEQIDWPCTIVKNYSEGNRGVYANIGKGAAWVFEREEEAIFLEDDNLPEITFFRFCHEMLERYKDDERILWICGTNYLENYQSKYSYVFSRHMLPCGWASWKKKFLKYYDGELDSLNNVKKRLEIRKNYESKKFYRYDRQRWMAEFDRIKKGQRPISWDYQMSFSIRLNGLYGVVPTMNVIENIGVDENSIHGGKSMDNIMTKRFCGMKAIPINFPLIHPDVVKLDKDFEKKILKIILPPLSSRIKKTISNMIKRVFKLDYKFSISLWIKRKLYAK